MKCVILSVGKEKDGMTDEVISTYTGRILRHMPLEWVCTPALITKEKEGDKLLSLIKKEDYVVLLDGKGSELRSEALAELIENRMVDGVKRLVFVIGGPYGVSHAVYERANYVWRLSALTFPHMLVRAIIAEQIYRACTILKNEPYHHA
jgi:23S rRNA (pseudouridine1915-N3)-methyltransferase